MKKKLIFTACALVTFSALPSVTYASGLIAPPNDLGLVGYWPFNSVSGTMTPDMSGNKNNGTTVNSPTLVTGKIGQALSFNGSSGVSVSSFAINTLTISAWIRTTQVVGSSGSAQIINRDTTGGNNSRDWQFRIQGSPAVPTIILFNTGGTIVGVSGTTTVNDGKWHLVTATWDGSTIRMYVDGKASGSPASFGGTLNSGSPLLFGETSGIAGGSNFNGSIDDARIYNRALSAAEVQRLYQSGVATHSTSPTSLVPNGLVGYWTFDGQNTNWTTNTTADVSGKGNTGTMVNMSPSTSPVLGRFGQALSFNGTSQYVSVPNPVVSSNSFSVSVWFRTTSDGVLISDESVPPNGSPAAYDPILYVETTGLLHGGVWAGTVPSLQTTTVVNNGRWHNAILVVDYPNSKQSLYEDGSLVGTFYGSPQGGHLAYEEIATGAGGWTNTPGYGWFYFDGSIDDARIYNRALTATEVKQLYNAGAIGTTIDTAPAQALSGGGLVGYWPFDGNEMNWASNLALDASGSGNNGTLVNMTTANAVMGKIGQALSFNGTNQSVNVPYALSLKPSSITLSAWFYYPASDPFPYSLQTLVGSWYSSGVWGWELDLGGSTSDLIGQFRLHIYSDSDGTYTVNHSYVFSPGKWQLITATYDAASGTEHIYANGALAVTKTITPGSLLKSSAPLEIGATYDNGVTRYFNGSIDDVRIYNRALSASEVKQLYNLGR